MKVLNVITTESIFGVYLDNTYYSEVEYLDNLFPDISKEKVVIGKMFKMSSHKNSSQFYDQDGIIDFPLHIDWNDFNN